MYLVAIAWGYVALMMALAEATSSQGSILGALLTLLLYGVLPISIVLYVMGAPRRREARRRAERDAQSDAQSDAEDGAAAARRLEVAADGLAQGDGGNHAAADDPAMAVAPEREKP